MDPIKLSDKASDQQFAGWTSGSTGSTVDF